MLKKNTLLLTSSALLFSLLVGCGSEPGSKPAAPESYSNSNASSEKKSSVGKITSIFPKSELTDSIAIDSVSKDQSVRAEQQTDKGTLLMISNGPEEHGHLLVSSVLGVEGDQTFQSNYSIIYRQGEQEKVLLELPAYIYVQPSDKKLSFENMSFADAEVYILTPQYKTGHGLGGYVFAIDKVSGDAFNLKIVKNGVESDMLLYSEETPLPIVKDNRLVVHPPRGAGTPEEETKEMQLKLDLKNKQLIAE
ncbi:hypothetical protein SAMN05444162_4874 [Paenibacillaceae bacterium GAS479]|nr:hypothetical protein SAMN05444162_4874 [Paenibacillaceae bacterium GAS479]